LAGKQTLKHLPPQTRIWLDAGMAKKMMQGLIHRPRLLLGLGQTIEIGEQVVAAAIQLEIELPACAELEQVQQQAPPDEKTLVVGDVGLKTRIGNLIQPVVELRPKMPHRANKPLTKLNNRP